MSVFHSPLLLAWVIRSQKAGTWFMCGLATGIMCSIGRLRSTSLCAMAKAGVLSVELYSLRSMLPVAGRSLSRPVATAHSSARGRADAGIEPWGRVAWDAKHGIEPLGCAQELRCDLPFLSHHPFCQTGALQHHLHIPECVEDWCGDSHDAGRELRPADGVAAAA